MLTYSLQFTLIWSSGTGSSGPIAKAAAPVAAATSGTEANDDLDATTTAAAADDDDAVEDDDDDNETLAAPLASDEMRGMLSLLRKRDRENK